MNFAENASRFFNRGYSCSQSVLSAYAPGYGLDERSAFKLASAFGGGMAHLDGACGAVTGALMVIGLGLIIGFIVIALFMPMITLLNSVSGS